MTCHQDRPMEPADGTWEGVGFADSLLPPSSYSNVQAFTLDVFGRRAADISIGPLFLLPVNNHAMRVDAKDTAKFLAAE